MQISGGACKGIETYIINLFFKEVQWFDGKQIWGNFEIKMEQKGLTSSTGSIEIDTFSDQTENNASDHELSAVSEEKATTQSFSWSIRKVVILASLCLVTVLSFGALSMIAPFFPHEVR